MAGRDAAMFVVGAAEPSPSGLLPLASEPTKALVKFAVAHFAALPKAHIAALSKSFGNFDRVVGIGWLIADAVRAVGAPLITRADAHAIGSKAQRKAADIKDEVRTARLAIQRAVYKQREGTKGVGRRSVCRERCGDRGPACAAESQGCHDRFPAARMGICGGERGCIAGSHGMVVNA